MAYGPAFRCIRELWRGPGEVLARVVVPATWAGDELGSIPALVDAALQAAIAGADALYVPFTFERVHVARRADTEAWISVQRTTVRRAGRRSAPT